jgi:hypothetical protein
VRCGKYRISAADSEALRPQSLSPRRHGIVVKQQIDDGTRRAVGNSWLRRAAEGRRPTSTCRSSDEHPCILRRLIAREPAAIRNRCHAAPGQTATHRRHGRACPGHPRLANVVVKFIPDEHFQPIPGRKAFDESCAMLECATRKIGRHPDIQRARGGDSATLSRGAATQAQPARQRRKSFAL